MLTRSFLALALTIGCNSSPQPPPPPPIVITTAPPIDAAPIIGTSVTLTNRQGPTTVYFNFGADSVVKPSDWSFCTVTAPLNCNFQLSGSQRLPTNGGKYLNVTLSFGSPVTCDMTKAELNVNNPSWYDIYDVSLVDGYSNKIQINYKSPDGAVNKLGPPNGKTGNEKIFGVYPYGCDVCVARQKPQCGISKGTEGCKTGSQYKPDVPCQFQGPVKGGGGVVDVILLAE